MNLTPNFTLEELRGESAPTAVRENLQLTANGLQAFRDILGAPMRVTSGYRDPMHNTEVGGVPTSDHMRGLAADVAVVGLSLAEVAQRLREYQAEGGKLPAFDQLIFYPYTTGHLHLGFGRRLRRAVMVKLKDGGYRWAVGTPYSIKPENPLKPAA